MSVKSLRASLALWRRRHDYRTRRLAAAHAANSAARIAKWHELRVVAGREIRRRERQIRDALHQVSPQHPVAGIDYTAMTPARAKTLGARFVIRYLSHDPSKNLTVHEAHELATQGIGIVLVWETSANRAKDGKAAGISDAQEAERQAHACGAPMHVPIIFAVDYDSNGPETVPYFQGVRGVLGIARTWAYGGYNLVKYLFDNHHISGAMQAYAWSGGKWDTRAQIQQYQNGAEYDLDRAVTSNYAQWR